MCVRTHIIRCLHYYVGWAPTRLDAWTRVADSPPQVHHVHRIVTYSPSSPIVTWYVPIAVRIRYHNLFQAERPHLERKRVLPAAPSNQYIRQYNYFVGLAHTTQKSNFVGRHCTRSMYHSVGTLHALFARERLMAVLTRDDLDGSVFLPRRVALAAVAAHSSSAHARCLPPHAARDEQAIGRVARRADPACTSRERRLWRYEECVCICRYIGVYVFRSCVGPFRREKNESSRLVARWPAALFICHICSYIQYLPLFFPSKFHVVHNHA